MKRSGTESSTTVTTGAATEKRDELLEAIASKLHTIAFVFESIRLGATDHLQDNPTGALIGHAAHRGEALADNANERLGELRGLVAQAREVSP